MLKHRDVKSMFLQSHGRRDVLPLSTQSSLSRGWAVEETEKGAPRRWGAARLGAHRSMEPLAGQIGLITS